MTIHTDHYSAVFFDFDGVILDSVKVKTDTFAAMFRKYGSEVERAVVEYHLANGGISRFDKFRYYYEKILEQPITDSEIKTLGDEFSKLALQGVLNSKFVPGALETLEVLKKMNIPCYIVSGTPDEEIKLIIKKKKLTKYFIEIHGAPKKKSDVALDIIKRFNFLPTKCLFIGDSMTDYDAAYVSRTNFLGISPCLKISHFPSGTWVKDRVELFKD